MSIKRIPIELTSEANEMLRLLKLKRSYELGRIVSKSLVLEELIIREFALQNPEQHQPHGPVASRDEGYEPKTWQESLGANLFTSRD